MSRFINTFSEISHWATSTLVMAFCFLGLTQPFLFMAWVFPAYGLLSFIPLLLISTGSFLWMSLTVAIMTSALPEKTRNTLALATGFTLAQLPLLYNELIFLGFFPLTLTLLLIALIDLVFFFLLHQIEEGVHSSQSPKLNPHEN